MQVLKHAAVATVVVAVGLVHEELVVRLPVGAHPPEEALYISKNEKRLYQNPIPGLELQEVKGAGKGTKLFKQSGAATPSAQVVFSPKLSWGT